MSEPGEMAILSASSASGRSAAGVRAQPADLPPIPDGVFCPDCGYDLHGLTGARCPECGFDLEVARAQTPQIPWAHRHEIGWRRAYWKTVWATLRARRFCIEMVRPVSYRDSQLFRWITYTHFAVPLLIAALLGLLLAGSHPDRGRDLHEVISEQGAVLLIWFAALPGLASYFFQVRRWPVERQNRAIALSYYAWGHLSWLSSACLALGLPLTPGVAAAPTRVELDAAQAPVVAIWCAYLLGAAAMLIPFARFQKHITGRGYVACIGRCVLLGVAAGALCALLQLLPLVVLWLRVVRISLE